MKTSHGSQSHLKNYKHTQRHSRDSHTNLDENGDWENLLLGPLARKYPELRQIYKRASSDERLLSASQIVSKHPFSTN